VAVSLTETGDTLQPLSPAVELAVALDTGGVSSTVNEPLALNAALPHASLARKVHV
jgi:hypothetical protein